MSSFSEMTQYSKLTGDTNLPPLMNDSSRHRFGITDASGALLLELRDEPPDLIPDVIDDATRFRVPVKTGTPGQTDKPDKTRKKNKSGKKGNISGRRGIDTLLRNAYRAQLDMLSLAAVKANIMISLNGLLISMLIISGTHFIGVNIWFAIPIVLFLLSSALATIFAVLAARPDVSRRKFSPKDFKDGKAHLLAFEEFSDLSEKQYVKAMSNMLQDDDLVYKNMIAHVHELGSTADRKYRKLHCSYTVFIGGIILSVMSLLIIEGMKWTSHLPPV